MARKKTMATAKKTIKRTGKVLEFFRAISGFWPVWLSTLVIVGSVFGYQYYENNFSAEKSQNRSEIYTEVSVSPEQIKIIGKLNYLEPNKVKRLVSENISSGLLSSDLNQIKLFVEAEPWVRSATIKRLPADVLQLHIEEQQPMLRWKNNGLISVHGDLFEPKDIQNFIALASISSPKTSIPKGLEILKKSILILKKFKLDLAQIREDKIGAWELKTTQGVVFKFGRKELQHRLQVLEKLWPSAIKKGSLTIVDLRYPNGAAVSYL